MSLFFICIILKNFVIFHKKREVNLARICSICGKRPMSGNNRSHSNRATKRKFSVNIQKIKFVDKNGKIKKGYVCTSCLRKVKKVI